MTYIITNKKKTNELHSIFIIGIIKIVDDANRSIKVGISNTLRIGCSELSHAAEMTRLAANLTWARPSASVEKALPCEHQTWILPLFFYSRTASPSEKGRKYNKNHLLENWNQIITHKNQYVKYTEIHETRRSYTTNDHQQCCFYL